MKNKNFLGVNDRSYEAAKSFRKMLHERKAGWYRGSVDYYLNMKERLSALMRLKSCLAEKTFRRRYSSENKSAEVDNYVVHIY